jgi:molybdate transport system substrate-binding protein
VRRNKAVFFLLTLALLLTGAGRSFAAEARITVFAGAASTPPLEEAARIFEEKYGTKVDLNLGGSGTVLSQMKMSRRGDVYIPGSPDFMTIAEQQALVDPKSVTILAYLLPAINVQAGNPKQIRTLRDLAKPGVKVGIGNPEAVCVGLYGVEILERNDLLKQVQGNIVTHAASCEATASLLVLKKVDAVLGWDVFSKWNPDKIETIFLQPSEIVRLAYIPAAVSTYSRNREAAQKFIQFLSSPEGRKVFSGHGYAVTEGELRKFAPRAQVGGAYAVPKDYKRK